MAVSIDNYLKNLASSYYLKNDSDEVRKINNSIETLFSNINKELGSKIKKKFVFGSYDRDTILPRRFDTKSDVDVMVVFNHTDYERTPETYRTWLKNFADKCYKDRYGSEVIKTSPTITIRLNNINYDLVPAKEEGILYPILYIPDGIGGWQSTNPNDVKLKLTDANTKYNNIVRPIIRLLKAWNAYSSYPFDSYLLELRITEMYFQGDNIQTGLFWAANYLNSTWDSQSIKDKIQSLQYNLEQAKIALEQDDLEKAKRWIHRVLPTV